ncbi:putative reverse transcriptase domain-containing protein, partial [Tanacetum coccineum]
SRIDKTIDGPEVKANDEIIASTWNLVDRSLTSAKIRPLSGIVPSTIDTKYYVELADGKVIGINTISDEFLTIRSNRSNGYASIDASKQELSCLIGLVMSIGLTNAPELFIDLMNQVRKPYLDRFVIVFIEDIFIYSSGNKECEEHFRLIMGLRKNNGFYTKFSKCEFWLLKVQFLGHVVDSQGIHVDTAKLKSIKD